MEKRSIFSYPREILESIYQSDLELHWCLISIIVSSLIGMASSLMINSSLLEISLDPFFSIVFNSLNPAAII